jgi:hypothetical protein
LEVHPAPFLRKAAAGIDTVSGTRISFENEKIDSSKISLKVQNCKYSSSGSGTASDSKRFSDFVAGEGGFIVAPSGWIPDVFPFKVKWKWSPHIVDQF